MASSAKRTSRLVGCNIDIETGGIQFQEKRKGGMEALHEQSAKAIVYGVRHRPVAYPAPVDDHRLLCARLARQFRPAGKPPNPDTVPVTVQKNGVLTQLNAKYRLETMLAFGPPQVQYFAPVVRKYKGNGGTGQRQARQSVRHVFEFRLDTLQELPPCGYIEKQTVNGDGSSPVPACGRDIAYPTAFDAHACTL